MLAGPSNHPGAPARRTAFSLSELIVSIGILVLMFALAGRVFTLTMRSSGQATALTEVSQLVRQFENTLRADLAQVEPGRSVILIQGNSVNAYWTPEGRDADDDNDPSNGYPHQPDPTRETDRLDTNDIPIPEKPRADMLMIFTARKGSSFAHAGLPTPITSNLQQVVYGHAILGDYIVGVNQVLSFVPGPQAFPTDEQTGYPDDNAPSPVPASQWHLARRGVLLLPTGPQPFRLDDPALLRGETDVVEGFDYEKLVLEPFANQTVGLIGDKWHLPGIFYDPGQDEVIDLLARSQLDPAPPAQLANRLGHHFVPNCASFKVEWTLDRDSDVVAGRLDAVREMLWIDPGDFDTANAQTVHPFSTFDDAQERLEEADLTEQAAQIGDLLRGDRLHPDQIDAPQGYSLMDRFAGPAIDSGGNPWPALAEALFQVQPAPPNMHYFGATRLSVTTGSLAEEDVFPAALRITIDVYDENRRMAKPVRHVIVVPVGQ